MKKKLFLILFAFVNFCYAQDKAALHNLPDLIPYNKNGLFGYCNQKLELKIEAKFRAVSLIEVPMPFFKMLQTELHKRKDKVAETGRN